MDTKLIVSLALFILLVISVGIVLCIKFLASKKDDGTSNEEEKPNTATNKEFNELLNQLNNLVN